MEMLNLAAVALFNTLEKYNIDRSLLIEGTGLKMEYMADNQKKHTWDQFVKMYENCSRLIGPENTAKEIAYQGVYNEKITLLRKVATGMLNAKTIYWYTSTFVAKHLFKESVVFRYAKVNAKQINMEISIHPDLVDCPLLLETYTKLFEILPALLGLPNARVEAVITERKAEYKIYFKHTSFFKLMYQRLTKVFESENSMIQLITELENQAMVLSKVVDEKSQLLRIVSHDIANQVSIIDYYLKKTMKNEELADDDKRHLTIAKNSSSKLYSILKNVQNMEISSARGIEISPVDLDSIFLSVADYFQPQLKYKNIVLKCRNELGLNVEVLAEATSLETNVIGNLITNAIKFSHEGSTIELQAKHVGEKVLISVIDQGIGIPLEERRTLFTKKIRVSSPGTNGEVGTGFGLGIVLNYVNLFNGKISVHSNVPQGSIVTIELDAYIPQNFPTLPRFGGDHKSTSLRN